MFFKDRYEAGRMLAEAALKARLDGDWDIVGIARGGVIIASEVAKAMGKRPKAICVEDMTLGTANLVFSSTGSGMVFTAKRASFLANLAGSENPKVQGLVRRTIAKQFRLAGGDTSYGERVLICDDGAVSGRTLITAVNVLRHYGVREVVAAIPALIPQMQKLTDFQVLTWRRTLTDIATGACYNHGGFKDVPDQEVMALLAG